MDDLEEVIGYELLALVAEMNSHRPIGNQRNTRSLSYQEIARDWITRMPYMALRKRSFNKNTLGIQLDLTSMRQEFNYTYEKAGRRLYWYDWFCQNAPLWQVLNKGNSYNKKVSEVMLTFNQIRYLDVVDPEIVKQAWENELSLLSEKNPDREYHIEYVAIDLENIQRYIRQTTEVLMFDHNKKYRDQTRNNLTEAKIIEAFALAYNEVRVSPVTGNRHYVVPQVYYDHPDFGRRYYISSINFQKMSDLLRTVVVGSGWTLDLNSSVWGFTRLLCDMAEIPDYSVITDIMENKNQFRSRIANLFTNTAPAARLSKAKQAITALGFGAGTLAYQGISTIIKNPDELQAFRSHPDIVQLVKIQNQIIDWVRVDFADEISQLKHLPDWRVGRQFNMKRYMAKMYQLYETAVMREVIQFVESLPNCEVVLWVHDGIYIRGARPDGYYNTIIQQNNPYASAELKRIDEYVYSNPASALVPDQHRIRMIEQQAQAENWALENGVKKRNITQELKELRMRNLHMYKITDFAHHDSHDAGGSKLDYYDQTSDTVSEWTGELQEGVKND